MASLANPAWYGYPASDYPDDVFVLDCGADGSVFYFIRGPNPDFQAIATELMVDLASWRADPQGTWVTADWGERTRPRKYRYWTL